MPEHDPKKPVPAKAGMGTGFRINCAINKEFPMPKIDESRPFIPVNIAILTVSDTRTVKDDKSGTALEKMLTKAGHALADRTIIEDNSALIRAKVQGWVGDYHRGYRLYRTRRDAGSSQAGLRERDRGLLDRVSHAEL
jgi:hypothetical protein